MSAIFYHDDEQRALAQESLAEKKAGGVKVQTQILPLETFHDAENYHQKYLLKRHSAIFNSLQLMDSEVLTSTVAARLNGFLQGYGGGVQLEKELPEWGLNEKQCEAIRSVVARAQKKNNCEGGVCTR